MSGVYIPGMEMPRKCEGCLFERWEHEYGEYCLLAPYTGIGSDWTKEVRKTGRREDCPLIPVPDHGRLIDKDALEQDISESVVFSGRENNPEIYGANKIINRIHHAPTIIPAEEETE